MKKKWFFMGVAVLVITSIMIYSKNKVPNLNGNPVQLVQIMDINGKVIAHWSLLEDKTNKNKEKIETVIKALELQGKLVERNFNQPNYWVHITLRNGGGDHDYLVWLEDNKQATFLPGSLTELKFGLGAQSAHPIESQIRDNLLGLLYENN